MALRYATTVLMAMILAAIIAAGLFTLQPRTADAADTVTVTGCTGAPVVLDANEKAMLDLHNKQRATKGLGSLCVHPALQRAAEAHSKDMIDNDYFSHTSQDGTTAFQRMKREGYNYRTAGENIAFGSGSLGAPANIFKNWMNSDGHRRNIMNKSYREIGIGAVTGTYGSYSNTTMWTTDFGAR